jgi:hypothetical protein
MMLIKHEAFNKILHKDCGDVFIKMFSVRNFDNLLKVISKISEMSNNYGYCDNESEDELIIGQHKFVGDLFEIFSEVFFKQLKSDNRIGVFDYQPVYSEDDNGVDAFGKNIDKLPCTIQIKYRSNPISELTERDIKQFPFQSILKYGVDHKRNDTMIIFTNCQGLHWYTDSIVFDNKIRVINGETIALLIDNNEGFWETFKEIINISVKNMGVRKLYKTYMSKLTTEQIVESLSKDDKNLFYRLD